jgi:hypothetical protein
MSDNTSVIDKQMGKNVACSIMIATTLNIWDRNDWRIKLIFVAFTSGTLMASLSNIEHMDRMLTWPSSNSKK